MAYRGEDLDLRTPLTWSGAASDMTGGPEPYTNGSRGRSASYRSTPILVDDVVLSCSNHAFDVAVAHRAGEVRLEHLLHALTRVDGASNALEARGIRVAGLRRESATIIAGEIPIGLSTGQGNPRRSEDFEQALRTASAIAYRRNAPANVDDLMDALLDMPSDIPGIALLARHGGRVARDRPQQREPMRDPIRDREIYREPLREPLRDPMRDWDQQASFQPLPPLTRAQAGYGSDLRGNDMRKSTLPYYSNERPLRPDVVGSAVDGIQNARIDQLESAVRSLATELTSDRKTDRDDANRFRGGLHDRLQSLEQSVMQVAGNDGGAAMLLDRLAAVERGLEQRLNELSRPWSLLSERLQALEQTILDNRGTKSGEVTAIQDRLIGLERGMFDRIKGLERTLEAAPLLDLNPVTSRLDIIEEAVLNPASNAAETDKLAERLRTLEETINGQRTQVNQANAALHHELKGVGAALSSQAANNERVHSFVSDRMQTLTSSFERQRTELAGPLTERLGSLATTFDGRMVSLAGLVERNKVDVTAVIEQRNAELAANVAARSAEAQATLAKLTERMAAFEANLTFSLEKAAEAQAVHTAELKEVHEALIKLNANQHTLAGSIDQWRLDGVGDISVIANRLDGIEKSTTKPIQMMEALTTSVDNINRATVERYHRRNRFMYWLFGTDDWLTASWPSQAASVEAERAMLRGTPPNAGVPKVSQHSAPSRAASR